MGKRWDYDVPSAELWSEVLRVLRPGGHLLAFAGTRTQHRMAVRIEDAGFEIRDMIAWVYGSGFPKSLDVSKAIDKAAGAEREVVGCDEQKAKQQTRAVGTASFGDYAGNPGNITAPATEAAQQWQGWGTALKPALEPITVARKPFTGTVAENVLQHGTGALNVDGCRVAPTGEKLGGSHVSTKTEGWDRPWKHDEEHIARRRAEWAEADRKATELGRWPANLIHDGSEEVVGLFPETVSGSGIKGKRSKVTCYGEPTQDLTTEWDGDSGSASRFFYCAKADASERRNSKHPTIKPVALMRYLVRLVTPPGGVVLDPFGGSGTTAEAARLEHCRFLLLELSPEYCADAEERLRQGVLF